MIQDGDIVLSKRSTGYVTFVLTTDQSDYYGERVCDLISLIIREDHGKLCMPCSSQIVGEMQPEIHIIEKRDFLKPIIHS